MSKYQVDDRLINFYTDENKQQRTRVKDFIIKKVPPFTDDNGEVITDKYHVLDNNLQIYRKILKENIENDTLYKKINGGGKKHRKSKKQRKSKKR